jgi:hypothetical protein
MELNNKFGDMISESIHLMPHQNQGDDNNWC